MKTKQLHYVSGIILLTFISLHLVNHMYSLYGADKHIELMKNLRSIYRNIIVESILLSSVVIQITTGISLYRTRKNITVSIFQKLHIWSGLYLAFFLFFHVNVVLAGRYLLHLDTNIYFGAAGLNTFPFYFIFFPYYGLSMIAVFTHLAAIHHQKMKSYVLGLSPLLQTYGILLFGVLIMIVVFYGLTNHFNGLPIPKEYNVMILK